MVEAHRMDSTLVATNPDGSTDSWRSTDIDLGAIWYWDRDTVLQKSYDAWSRLGHPPMSSQFAPALEGLFTGPGSDAAENPGACLFYAETGRTNPFDYRIVTPHNDRPSVRLRDVQPALLRTALMSDLNICKYTFMPCYQQIWRKVGGNAKDAVRLLLPTIDEAGDVHRIYGLSRPVANDAPPIDETTDGQRRTHPDYV